MEYLDRLESHSIYVIREAFARLKPLAMLWSLGKDSSTMLWLVHPLLEWTEIDVWFYVKREGIPVVSLYFARGGKRYRSLGEKNITHPIDSDADTIDAIIQELRTTRQPERAGRAMDHESEDAFEGLRNSGYM